MRISVDPKPLFIALLAAALIGLSYPVAAQLSVEDISLIRERDFREQLPSGRKVTLMRIGPNALTRYNPVSLSFSGLLFFYQKVVSTQLAANCPYEISCSNFSKKTITEYGLLKGLALSADRLMRCNQIAAYDIHPMLINDRDRIYDPVEQYRLKP